MRTSAALLAMVAIAALAGCGGTEVDAQSLEEAIPHDVTKLCKESPTPCTDANGRVTEPIVSASCPSGIEAKKGETFTCEVTLKNGKHETARIELTSDNADYGFRGFVGGRDPNK